MAQLTEEQIEQFGRDRYLMVESLFDAEEMELLLSVAGRYLEKWPDSKIGELGRRQLETGAASEL